MSSPRTKNGRGKYVIMDAGYYETIMDEIKLLGKITSAEQRISNGESYMSMLELKAKLGV